MVCNLYTRNPLNRWWFIRSIWNPSRRIVCLSHSGIPLGHSFVRSLSVHSFVRNPFVCSMVVQWAGIRSFIVRSGFPSVRAKKKDGKGKSQSVLTICKNAGCRNTSHFCRLIFYKNNGLRPYFRINTMFFVLYIFAPSQISIYFFFWPNIYFKAITTNKIYYIHFFGF